MHVAFELIVVCCERIQGLKCEQQTVILMPLISVTLMIVYQGDKHFEWH